MSLPRPPWFQDGQCSDETVKGEDGGWWKESLPSAASAGEGSDGCTEENAGSLETKWLFTLTNHAISDFSEAGFSTKERKFALYRLLCGTNE